MHNVIATGMPNLLAISTVVAAPNSTVNPQKGLISVNSFPTVLMTHKIWNI
jgi:hypothetical protein